MELRDIPLFASLSEEGLQLLRQRLRRRHYAEGEVILRAGDPARELHVVLEGAARVELGGEAPETGRRAVLAAAGQTLGEMSVLSNSPVSATVVAQRPVVTLALGAEDLADLLEAEPALYRTFAALLIERLRHRTDARALRLRPAVAVLAFDSGAADTRPMIAALARGVAHYSPGSRLVEADGMDAPTVSSRIEQWRREAAGDQYLLIATPGARYAEVSYALRPGDVALWIRTDARVPAVESGPADARVVLWRARPEPRAATPWVEAVGVEEVAACRAGGDEWIRARYPVLDRIVRFITYREIGVAMSVGAAAGFAHLGFLEVLEQCQVPLDFICGSSMGGAVALSYGQLGAAASATEALCRLGTEFARSRGLQIVPQSGLVSQHRMRQIATALFGEHSFSDLLLPVAVVAADVVAGERIVLDRGPIAAAAQATVAIPGLLPPVRLANRILVDGGLVTRVPIDLVMHRRCGLRLASVVVPRMPASQAQRDEEAERLQARLDRPFGFRAAVAAAWKLVGWWDSAVQTQRADIVIRTAVEPRDGLDFSAGARIVELGRQASLAQAGSIRSAVRKLLTPGAP